MKFSRVRNRKFKNEKIIGVYVKNTKIVEEKQKIRDHIILEEHSLETLDRKFYRATQNLNIHTTFNKKGKSLKNI